MPATAASARYFRVATFGGAPRIERTDHLVTLDQAHEMLWLAQRPGSAVFVNAAFETVVALADRGAYQLSWADARQQAVDEALATGMYEGHGLGSSDANHITVSFLRSAPVWEPASPESRAPEGADPFDRYAAA